MTALRLRNGYAFLRQDAELGLELGAGGSC